MTSMTGTDEDSPAPAAGRPRRGVRALAQLALVLALALSLAANALLLRQARSAAQRAARAEGNARSLESELARSDADKTALLHSLGLIRARAVALQRTARELEQLAASAAAPYQGEGEGAPPAAPADEAAPEE